jgi:hypothetical protein
MSRHKIPETQRHDWRMLSYGAVLLAPAAVLSVAWPRLAANLFATPFAEQMFMLHGMCYLWVPALATYLFHGSFWPLEYSSSPAALPTSWKCGQSGTRPTGSQGMSSF